MKLEDCFSRDVNITELAKLMRFSRNQIANVLAGRLKPTWRFLEALEKVPLESVKKKYVKKRLNSSLNNS